VDRSEIVAVIRSAGERTASICRSVVAEQLGDAAVHVVNERPFEAALRACYRLGIESGVPWMLTVDADVIPRDGAVGDLLTEARRLPGPYAQIEGVVHDKLLGDFREAGHRIYRTRYLPMALEAVPADGAALRPEFTTLERLGRMGHPTRKCDIVFGIHDYEQYYRDLYRKAYVQGQKHPHWLWERVPTWRELGATDPDFQVAARGAVDGAQAVRPARIDVDGFGGDPAPVLHTLALSEKAGLDADPQAVVAVRALAARVLAAAPRSARPSLGDKLAAAYERVGAVRFVPYVFGKMLQDLGYRIRRSVDRD
jgi:hypothetical protein